METRQADIWAETCVDQFIGEFNIDTEICDSLVSLFKKSKINGLVRRGQVGGEHGYGVNPELKDSWDLGLIMVPDDMQIKFKIPDYYNALKECVDKYFSSYPSLNNSGQFSLVESPIIQHYMPGGGYFLPHYERANFQTTTRMLVWMTYLNDVTEGGGTHFTYQNLTKEARKGRTLIWPTDFTHTHHGIASMTQDKYIITGWLNYSE
ncbi:2OG-Fe(II) oxygenase [Sulfuriflexus mobilis]|uniref:2OG-Fe(II) oxygenase n=1 Tax=Sulfuriflexus mobilis TaxID=1811807 RepID=UPI0015593093|nr:2OG-Fe(II) oxygenase [Sulfuriflexus mobilis]